LWVGAEKGIPALLLYLAFFFLIVYNLLIIIRFSSIQAHKVLSLLLLGGTVAYMIVAFFNQPYERPEHQLMLAMFGAAAVVMVQSVKPLKVFSPSKYMVIIPLAVLSVSTIIYGMAAVSHEVHIRKAIDARNAGKWDEMLNQSVLGKNSLTSLDPFAFPADYYQGMALANLNRNQEAIDALKLAKRQSPHNLWINNQMGQCYYNMGKYNLAQKSVEKVLSILPNYKEALISLSAIYYQKQRYGKAFQTLKKIEGWQHDPQIVGNLKVLREKQKEKQVLLNKPDTEQNP
jgi:tetratricopeptide (TPR) repeat protein